MVCSVVLTYSTIRTTLFNYRLGWNLWWNRSPCGSPRFCTSPLCVWRACLVPARRPKFLSWFLCFMVHFINLTCGFTPDSRCRKLPQKRQLPASETSRGCSQKQGLGQLGMSHRAEAVRDLIETRILRPGLHGLWWWRISFETGVGHNVRHSGSPSQFVPNGCRASFESTGTAGWVVGWSHHLSKVVCRNSCMAGQVCVPVAWQV